MDYKRKPADVAISEYWTNRQDHCSPAFWILIAMFQLLVGLCMLILAAFILDFDLRDIPADWITDAERVHSGIWCGVILVVVAIVFLAVTGNVCISNIKSPFRVTVKFRRWTLAYFITSFVFCVPPMIASILVVMSDQSKEPDCDSDSPCYIWRLRGILHLTILVLAASDLCVILFSCFIWCIRSCGNGPQPVRRTKMTEPDDGRAWSTDQQHRHYPNGIPGHTGTAARPMYNSKWGYGDSNPMIHHYSLEDKRKKQLPNGHVKTKEPSPIPEAATTSPEISQVSLFDQPSDQTSFEQRVQLENYMHINTNITYRYAITQVRRKVCNYSDHPQEVKYELVFPKSAFLTSFEMQPSGKIIGLIQDKNTAKTQAYSVTEAGDHKLLGVAMTISGKSTIVFEATYEQLLHRNVACQGKYEYNLYVAPQDLDGKFTLNMDIKETRDIKWEDNFGWKWSENQALPNKKANVQQNLNDSLQLRYTLNENEARDIANGIQQMRDKVGVFYMQYDVTRGRDGGDLLVGGDNFVHFATPGGLLPFNKSIIFVLDKSGSMQHEEKAENLKLAMAEILLQLKAKDYFSIITFSHVITKWPSDGKLRVADENSKEQATTFVQIEFAKPNGATDINTALMEALQDLQDHLTEQMEVSIPIIVFLTDGKASGTTVKVHSSNQILNNVEEQNKENGISIHTVGLGDEFDKDFLEEMAKKNSGSFCHISNNSDSNLRSFFKEVGSPILKNIKFRAHYPDSWIEPGSLTIVPAGYKSVPFDESSDLIRAGKLTDDAGENVQVSLSYKTVEGPMEYRCRGIICPTEHSKVLERIWAYMTVVRNDMVEKVPTCVQYKLDADVTSLVLTKVESTK